MQCSPIGKVLKVCVFIPYWKYTKLENVYKVDSGTNTNILNEWSKLMDIWLYYSRACGALGS